jgi:iron complex transport system ATP-binding protein
LTALVAENVHVQWGGRAILSGVSLTLDPGDFLVLVGPNGAGKTSLIRAAVGLVQPTRGTLRLDGHDVAQMPHRKRAARVAWLPQLPVASEPYPALELVAAARYRFGESVAHSRGAARRALGRVGAAQLETRPITALSGGERQRVAIAALLAQEAPLLLLDEPANHLDPAQQLEIYRLLGSLWQQGVGILCVTHDVNCLTVLPNADRARVLGLAGGRCQFELTFGSAELPDALSELFGVRMRVLEEGRQRAILPWPGGASTPPSEGCS